MRPIKKIVAYCLCCCLLTIGLSGCRKVFSLDNVSPSPYDTFNELWQFMDEHYALFDIKKVDWGGIKDKYSVKLKEKMTEDELFSLCTEMLMELKDGHLTLISSVDTSTYSGFYELYPLNFNLRVILDGYLRGQYLSKGPFVYKIEREIGYLYCSTFEKDFSDSDLEEIMRFFVGTKGLIVDVRGNTGGKGDNVNRLAKYFLDQERLMKYEVFKTGPGHTDFSIPRPFYLKPATNAYKNPLVLVTNRSCFSACNDFALYLSIQKQVTQVGDQTGGGGSAPANYILANGWKLQYSSSITLSPDRIAVEGGIQPDFKINISPIDEANGLDPIIEKAFSILQ